METYICTTHPNNILYIQSRKNTNTHLDSHTNQKTALSLSTTACYYTHNKTKSSRSYAG